MELGLVTETWGADDQTWLGSRHGTGNGRSVTLSFTGTGGFTKGDFADGFVPSGTPLARRASDDRVIPYVELSSDAFLGFLLSPVKVPSGNDAVGSLLDHGRVRYSRLPAGEVFGTQTELTAAAVHFVVED